MASPSPRGRLLAQLATYERLVGDVLGYAYHDEAAFMSAVESLLVLDAEDQLAREQRIVALRKRIRTVERSTAAFARQLLREEEALFEMASDKDLLRDVSGNLTKQTFTVDQVLVLAEKLALYSHVDAPAGQTGNDGDAAQLINPPAPHAEQMLMSCLFDFAEDYERARAADVDDEDDGAGDEKGDVKRRKQDSGDDDDDGGADGEDRGEQAKRSFQPGDALSSDYLRRLQDESNAAPALMLDLSSGSSSDDDDDEISGDGADD